ncbi:dTMP kinase [Candidatus Parcubacteria bacterium]|nr:dTMP kinase [Candidatus Parcubacteria bacterium]
MDNFKQNIGKFIVIDGTDGSGKTTQTTLLKEWLEYSGYGVETISFPQNGTKSAGLVEEYLEGKYGEAKEVSPYTASVFYAVDRFDASFKIKKYLRQGKIVLADRYVTSNLAHQGGKINNKLDRNTFYDWVRNFEYKLFNIPAPDAVFILHVETEISQSLALMNHNEDWQGKTNDIHEKSVNHLRQAEKIYLELAAMYPEIKVIKCTRNGRIMPKDEISESLWTQVRTLLNIHEHHINQSPYEPTITPPKPETNQTIEFTRLSELALLPQFNALDNSYLLTAADYYSIPPGSTLNVATGIKILLPPKAFGWIVDTNHKPIKIINRSYDQEIKIETKNTTSEFLNIVPGQAIAKLLIIDIKN